MGEQANMLEQQIRAMMGQVEEMKESENERRIRFDAFTKSRIAPVRFIAVPVRAGSVHERFGS